MDKQVTVFAASSDKVPEEYLRVAEEVARVLVRHQYRIRYGGGSKGLMGRLADQTIEEGGIICGIIPRFMIEAEWAHENLNELKVVETMHERKHAFLQDTDAIIALPGGTGTLEELLETLTLKRLGKFTKPVIIVNTGGFYELLLEFLEKMIREHFLRPEHRQMWSVISTPDQLIESILQAPLWDASALEFAAV